MCGICGLIEKSSASEKEVSIRNMVSVLKHRGPDNQNIYFDTNISLGHARLSILDLSSAANQPMVSHNGKYIIVYNGELYNFKDLRLQLSERGYIFNTNSDTEVVLNGYDAWGDSFFVKMNGIFAFSIWCRETKTLKVVRDRLGVKPLYYYVDEDKFVFASEIKSILANKSIIPKINYDSLHEYLYYGNAIGSKTLFKKIVKVKPGRFLTVSEGKITENVYWDINNIKEITTNEFDAANNVKNLIDEAVKRQLVSDVPVGVFLSGGIDSSCITAFAKRYYPGKLNTYSCAFDFDIGINELKKARQVANFYDTNHNELFIEGKDLNDIITRLVYHHDEPFGDAANIPLYLLTKEVSNSQKVILQGDGGDELFGGYRRYNTLSSLRTWKIAAPFLNAFFSIMPETVKLKQYRRFCRAMLQDSDAIRMALLLTEETLEDSPTNVFSYEFKSKVSNFDPFAEYKKLDMKLFDKDVVQKMLWTDMQILLPETFLEKVDKSTMANGVEVRVPFLDNNLVEYAMSLPSNLKIRRGEKKFILRKALRSIVPDDVLDAPKTGFGVPFSNWLKGPLKDFMQQNLNDAYIQQLNLFDNYSLNRLINLHLSGKKNSGILLWKLMNLCIWLKKYKVEIDE